jgi:outer membrane receptor protein involved in Fe transport
MRKLIVLLFLGLLLYPIGSIASVYGILKGKVTDEDGKGLKGATVLVEGTTRGTYVREADGGYTIVNIPSGKYTIKFSFTGLQAVRNEIRISADETSTMNVVLKSDVIRTGEVTKFAEKLVRNDDEGSKKTISSEGIQNTATSQGLAGVIALQAGVFQGDGGFVVRGSRAEETQFRVDGIDASNQFTGGFGNTGTYYYPMVSQYAIEETQVISGGFQAEYGDATGGIINASIQTGKLDKYDGWIRWKTDLPSLFGSQSSGIKLEREATGYKAVQTGDGPKYLGGEEHTFEFGTGGPLPFIERSTFFLSGKYLFEKYQGNSYDIRDPAGNSLGQLPDNRVWSRNITPKFKFGITDKIALTVGATYGVMSFESAGRTWLYNNDQGWVFDKMGDGSFKQRLNADGSPVLNGIPERIEKQGIQDNIVTNYTAKISHTFETSFYEITIGYSQNNEALTRRVGWSDPSFFNGFDRLEPTDNYQIDKDKLIPGKDKIVDDYSILTETSYTKDGYLEKNIPKRNPLTGYYEGAPNASTSNNPYGINYILNNSGGSGGIEFRDGNWFTVDGNYTNVFDTGEFNHTFKTGFLLTLFELQKSGNYTPWDGNPFYDVYTDGSHGGNLYADDAAILSKTNQAKKPTKIGMFVQDQVKYNDIIISGGLRFDYLDPNSQYRIPTTNFVSIKADSGFADATVKMQVSPRLQVAYPITESSNLRIAYGIYFQMPRLNFMYDNFNLDKLRSGTLLGNPNMEAQRTNQYEVAYSNSLTETFAITVTAYYKDIYNQLGVLYIPAIPDPYKEYTVAEYGSSRGIDFGFSKSPADNFNFDLNYSLGSVTGTSSNPDDNNGVQIDPYTDLPAFPLAEYPTSNDIRHFFKGTLRFFWDKDQGPSIGDIQLLENTNLTFTGSFRTGMPYTKTDKNGLALSEKNIERQPSLWNINLKLSKTFYLKDIFGDNAGQNSTVEFYFDVTNLLNRTEAINVNSTTGDPIDDGATFIKKVGDFSSTQLFKTATLENPATYASSQYDVYGNRIYNEAADFDKNGVVTQAERYEAYFKLVENNVQFRGNFQIPRQVFFGMMFRF